MPLLTADVLVRRVRLLVNDQLDGVAVQELLDDSFRALTMGGQWAALKFDGVLTTTPQQKTGTVAATQGSTSVLGTGTSFVAADAGSYLHIDGTPYVIDSLSGQTATLTSPYAGETGSGKAYTVTKGVYELDVALENLLSIGGPNWSIYEQSQNYLDGVDLKRMSQGQPYAYAFRKLSASGAWQIELWPLPTEVFHIRYFGLRRGTVTSRTDTLHTDFYGALVKRTAALACQTLAAKTKEAHWLQLAGAYIGEYQAAYMDLKRKNRRRFGTDTFKYPYNIEADPFLDLHGATGILYP